MTHLGRPLELLLLVDDSAREVDRKLGINHTHGVGGLQLDDEDLDLESHDRYDDGIALVEGGERGGDGTLEGALGVIELYELIREGLQLCEGALWEGCRLDDDRISVLRAATREPETMK